ncbi:cubilin-like [Rattus rattus]|uniref:cubilin-like n=1 Tax=Rattus rattus TaxID=10117 RepID=UPI0013F2BD92|nr:cubilin-like [Rattus rattus]
MESTITAETGNTYEVSDQVKDCNREYNQTFGNLKSPGWPQNYDNNLDCTIILRAPQNHSISLFFYWFQLEDSRQCMNDFLEVRNGGSSTSPLLDKYCSNLLPNPVFSQSNELYLHFHSDHSVTNNGYEIIWTSSPTGCGGTLLGDEGIFTNPGFPGSYPNNTHCEWTIVAPSGRPVSVGFPFLSIDSSGGCDQNYLIVFNGPDANSPPFGPLCGIDSALPSAVRRNPAQYSVLIPISACVIKHGLSFYSLYQRKCTTDFIHSAF